VRSSVSIALFFLLSAFFLFALLAALQHSGKALGIALACLAGVACIIIFLTPVRLPAWLPLKGRSTTTTVMDDTSTSLPPRMTTTTLIGVTTTTGTVSGTTTTGAGP
jgi:hypothetical protein